jgi:apolipoprotein N-acyltransferase
MSTSLSFVVDQSIDRSMLSLPARLGCMTKWRRIFTLIMLGALAALALPPIGLVPVLLISITGLIWAWDGAKSYKAAFMTGWWWSLGFYTAGFYWIANALLTDAARFGWMIPFATLGLGGLVGVFSALSLTAAHAFRCPGPARIIWVAIFWTGGEWLRCFVLTGFPWNPMGSVWDGVLPILQAGSVVGVHGLSLMTVLCFGLLASVATTRTARVRVVVVAVALGLPLAVGFWGQARLDGALSGFVPGIKLRLVQPGTGQSDKRTPEAREKTLRELVYLSQDKDHDGITHVIWPESAVLFDLAQDGYHRSVAALASPPGGLLLAGAPRFKLKDDGEWQYWNSLIALDPAGDVLGIYDKSHLVPFGEYVPLRGIMPFPRVVASMGDFIPGPGPRTLHLPGLPPVGPVICYESIFPGQVVVRGADRPQWMLIVTNDGWFGNSAGPYQHFAAAKMRAIEEGLPVVRAANTGISGVIDSYGRVTAQLHLGDKGIVDAELPVAQPLITLYGRWLDVMLAFVLSVFAMIAVITRKHN